MSSQSGGKGPRGVVAQSGGNERRSSHLSSQRPSSLEPLEPTLLGERRGPHPRTRATTHGVATPSLGERETERTLPRARPPNGAGSLVVVKRRRGEGRGGARGHHPDEPPPPRGSGRSSLDSLARPTTRPRRRAAHATVTSRWPSGAVSDAPHHPPIDRSLARSSWIPPRRRARPTRAAARAARRASGRRARARTAARAPRGGARRAAWRESTTETAAARLFSSCFLVTRRLPAESFFTGCRLRENAMPQQQQTVGLFTRQALEKKET